MTTGTKFRINLSRRSVAIKVVSTLAGMAMVGGAAYGVTSWVVGLSAGSSGEGQSATVTNLTITAVATPSASNQLYPGDRATWWQRSLIRTRFP